MPHRIRTRGPNNTRFSVPGSAADGTIKALIRSSCAHCWQADQSSSIRALGSMPFSVAFEKDTRRVSSGNRSSAAQGRRRSSLASSELRMSIPRSCSAQQVNGCRAQYWTARSPAARKRLSRRLGLAQKGVSQSASRKATSTGKRQVATDDRVPEARWTKCRYDAGSFN